MPSLPFQLRAPYAPAGDQPQAIDGLLQSLEKGNQFQTLLGVTGSGKTFTLANIIEKVQKPTLIIAHNKTLAAQLAQEFAEFFPNNAVHYFVSYYDYYQPEAYVVKTGSYIEKEASINAEIDRLRHAATESLLTRKDVIIVASVSCIYGIGEVDQYQKQCIFFEQGKTYILEEIITALIAIQFVRSTTDWHGGMFQVKGDTLEIWPSSSEYIIRLEFFGNELEKISVIAHLSHAPQDVLQHVTIFPAKHFVTDPLTIRSILPKIQQEMHEQISYFQNIGKLVEAERIKMRVEYDMEMLAEVGYVNGIENYSIYLGGRTFGDAPSTLLEFFPKNPDGTPDFLTCIDESHMTIPQIQGMYHGDQARKENLIQYGFRLPSARENRPLTFSEFEQKIGQTIFVSATPSVYESEHQQYIAEQIIRPTGLLDPTIQVESMEFMTDSLLKNIAEVKSRNERALITTITKKSSEDLALYLAENNIHVRYLHSEIETLERLEILQAYRKGEIDVIVGVNLLREGLDLPETSFIGILDAEKIGFLRSKTSLLQIIGRAARNIHGKVIMYVQERRIDGKYTLATSIAMQEAISETERRREIQHDFNQKHHITPKTIISSIKNIGISSQKNTEKTTSFAHFSIKQLELERDIAAANLDFERAALLRDELFRRKK